jgi:hypothetical protein
MMFLKDKAAKVLMRRALKARFPNQDPAPVIAAFLDSPLTTMYRGVYSHPTEERPGFLNQWRGPTLRPKEGDCGRIKHYLLNDLCSGDEDADCFFTRYLAHALQKPEEKPGVKIVLGGGQGTGKSTLGRILARIWGPTYLHVHDVKMITADFNGPLVWSFIIFLEEALFVGNRSVTNMLKALVTEPLVMINDKSISQYQTDSFHRFFVASNEDHIQHTERDDRRDFVLRVSDRHRGDVEYWNALYAEIDGDGTAAFMHELLQLDISDFDVRRRPMTAALVDQKLRSLDDVGRWLLQCLRDGYIEGFSTDWPRFLSTMQALERIEAFAGARRYRRLTPQELVPRVLKLCPSAVHGQPRMHGGRRHGFTLPPLEVAREEFEQHIEGEIAWEP